MKTLFTYIKKILQALRIYSCATGIYDFINYNLSLAECIVRILRLDNQHRVFFFYPFYHTGGAEVVHLDIVKAFKGKSVIFFTGTSADNHFINQFKEHHQVFEIDAFLKRRRSAIILLKLIGKVANKQKGLCVFGCYSYFFYNLLDHLKKGVKRVDLIHAFTKVDEPGFEKFSLPFVAQLDERVVISLKGKEDMIAQYSDKDIPVRFQNRIRVIENMNRFEAQSNLVKQSTGLNLLFVGRNSPEKRVYLVGKIATKLKSINNSYNVRLVGADLIDGVMERDRDNCDFLNAITEESELLQEYRAAHIILITSFREGFPMVIMEGMSQGVIPICTDVGAISNYIIPNQNGFVVSNSNDDEVIVADFVKLILNAEKNKTELSANCIEFASKHFLKKQFEKAYNEILS